MAWTSRLRSRAVESLISVAFTGGNALSSPSHGGGQHDERDIQGGVATGASTGHFTRGVSPTDRAIAFRCSKIQRYRPRHSAFEVATKVGQPISVLTIEAGNAR